MTFIYFSERTKSANLPENVDKNKLWKQFPSRKNVSGTGEVSRTLRSGDLVRRLCSSRHAKKTNRTCDTLSYYFEELFFRKKTRWMNAKDSYFRQRSARWCVLMSKKVGESGPGIKDQKSYTTSLVQECIRNLKWETKTL